MNQTFKRTEYDAVRIFFSVNKTTFNIHEVAYYLNIKRPPGYFTWVNMKYEWPALRLCWNIFTRVTREDTEKEIKEKAGLVPDEKGVYERTELEKVIFVSVPDIPL
jgi:hypothetical protein